jgi:hypothetical protein
MYALVSAYFNDLHSFSSIDLLWRDLSSMTVGPLPTPRSSFGFASAGEKLYLYGGFSFAGVIFFICTKLENYQCIALHSVLY